MIKMIFHAVALVVVFLLGIYIGVHFPNHAGGIDKFRDEAMAEGHIEILKQEEAHVSGDDPAALAKRADYETRIVADQARIDADKQQLHDAGFPTP